MLVENFADTICIGGEGIMTAKDIDATMQILKVSLGDVLERRKEAEKGAADEDSDDKDREDLEEELECEYEFQQQIGECLGAIIRSAKGMAVAPFDAHMKDIFGPLLAPGMCVQDRMLSMCAFIDIIEHGAPEPVVMGYAAAAVPAMASYTTDKDADLRQAAAYGLGICAKVAPEQFSAAANDALNHLNMLISNPTALEEDNRGVTDNAVSAMGKIGFYLATHVDSAAVTPLWLQRLPLRSDRIEAKNSIMLIGEMLQANFAPLGAAVNTAHILSVLADGLTLEEAEGMTGVTPKQAVMSALQALQAAVPAEVLQQGFSSLPPAQQALLQSS